MRNVFGPTGSHALIDQPLPSTSKRYADVTVTWFKDCSAPGKGDGTTADADFMNNIVGNLSRVVDTASGVSPKERGDMYLLMKCIQAHALTVFNSNVVLSSNLPLAAQTKPGAVYASDAPTDSVVYGIGPDGYIKSKTFTDFGLARSGVNNDITRLKDGCQITTAAPGDNSIGVANCAFVGNAISTAIGVLTAGSPAELDTFLEAYNRFLADESALSTLTTQVAARLVTANNLSEIATAGAVAQQAARSNLAIWRRVAFGDVNVSLGNNVRVAALTAALTAPRTWTLPAASALTPGERIEIIDEVGGVSLSNPLNYVRAGSDTINAGTSGQIISPYTRLVLESDGASRWTYDTSTAVVIPSRTNVRQTVQGGPQSGNVPSFLPATTGSLSITMQNVSTGANALTVSAAQGSNSTGQNDITSQISANVSWNALVGAQTVSSVSTTTTVATFTTGAAHNLVPGAIVIVSGASQAALNGTFVVASVPSTTTFTVNGPNPQTGTAFTAGSPTGASYAVTNFLALNAATGARYSTLLPPSYVFGGALATVLGQFTFDRQAMLGYLGDGTNPIASTLVFVGEAVTSTTAVTSSVAYAYNGYFDSGFTNTLPGVATAVNSQHGIGTSDVIGAITVRNITPEGGYAAGDIVAPYTNSTSGTHGPFSPWSSRNTGGYTTGSIINYIVVNKTSGTGFGLTNANWAYRTTYRRSWGGA